VNGRAGETATRTTATASTAVPADLTARLALVVHQDHDVVDQAAAHAMVRSPISAGYDFVEHRRRFDVRLEEREGHRTDGTGQRDRRGRQASEVGVWNEGCRCGRRCAVGCGESQADLELGRRAGALIRGVRLLVCEQHDRLDTGNLVLLGRRQIWKLPRAHRQIEPLTRTRRCPQLGPCVRKRGTCTDQLCAGAWQRGDNGQASGIPQRLTAITRGVTHVHDHIAQRRQIKLVRILGQLELPVTDGPHCLERQIAIIVEVDLEHARIVAAGAERDRLDRSRAVREAIVASLRLSGRPIIYANIALAATFAIFSVSSFQPIASFGLLSAVTILGCLVEDLLLLPARLTSPVFRAHGKHHNSTERRRAAEEAQRAQE